MEQETKRNWTNTLFLLLTPPIGVGLLVVHVLLEGFAWAGVGLFVLFYLLTGLAVTAGYHRLFAHRSYRAHPFVRACFLFFGAASFQNSALKWCSDHRRHHSFVDSDRDPYSIQRGFFHAHMGWIMQDERRPGSQEPFADLKNDRLVALQDRFYLPLAVLAGLVLPTLLGWVAGIPWGGLALGGVLRIVVAHHSTFLVNSLSHYAGTQPYTEGNSARDSWVTALLTYGEGYHNYHHFFQSDYRNGVRWYHYDPTKWLIATLARVGLAHDLKETPDELILKARLRMEAVRLKEQAPRLWSVNEMMANGARLLEERLASVQELRRQLSASVEETAFVSETRERIRTQLASYRAELRAWRAACRQLINPALGR